MEPSLEEQERDAWKRSLGKAEMSGRPFVLSDHVPNPDPPAAWLEFLQNAREELGRDFGEARVADRFCVPEDFATFMRIEGRFWECEGESWEVLMHPTGDLHALSIGRISRLLDDGFWLCFGSWGGVCGERMLFLCCDRQHPLFGSVVVGFDSGSPYLSGVPSPNCRVASKSFLEYLHVAEGIRPPALSVPVREPEKLPVPTHLKGWVVPLSFERECLQATVRCPCGCERFQLSCLGGVSRWRDGPLLPRVVEIDGGFYFIIEVECAECAARHVLFDKDRHGCDGFLRSAPLPATEPPHPLTRWACEGYGSTVHAVGVEVVIDYRDRYFEYKHFLRHGIDRWPDAFGWIDIGIRCCTCGRKTGWVSLETR